ncbi:AraC family transcriptional regulator [Sedimentibacter sp. zth1]|uniref:AraC family transcriptional regulator n=1 Tax=Sedimentibacter sp. zth1 TaxID=2816908 RepID=UPI001A927A90|nr:AraC family transcriptional regulator [Sedimentibacter sp. zth1]QSX05007.1 AraC family transcriptional regulator [Sedimentibacter sp. zth1]
MNYIQSMQKAIEYMEEHILNDINYEDVAKQVYMSNYHFHRTFSMLTGITANEYIRNRKLSMAGQELIMSNVKIIDIAYKYGYDSPESFTKAFTRFHGVTPNVAKRAGMELKSFNRLIIKIQLEGGTIMDYKIVERKSFKLLAKVKAFRNEIVSDESNTEIPDFWSECIKAGVIDKLKQNTKSHNIYGACAPISEKSNCFDYGIGMEYNGGKLPKGYRIWDVKPTLWAVFKCIGNNGDCIGETWDRIFKEFLPSSEYNMLDDTDFELYPEDTNSEVFCEVWIPVEKK